mgnify:CR=1 FL=1
MRISPWPRLRGDWAAAPPSKLDYRRCAEARRAALAEVAAISQTEAISGAEPLELSTVHAMLTEI